MSSRPAFVHLRLHSEYSVVDSLIRIKPLVSRVASLGMPAVALTDHSNFYGLIKFYSAARGKGIKPLCGCDLFVAEDDNPELTHVLPLLVRDQTGYRNLIRLISRAHQQGQYRGTIAVRRSWLAGNTEGLIALSGASKGDVGKALLAGDPAQARTLLEEWKRLFPEAYYLELQRTGRAGDNAHVARAVDLALATDTPVVATNDVRFLKPEEFEAHEVRVCINDRRTLDDPRRPRLYSEQQYLRSPEEMHELFSDLPEALENTVQIARRCNLDLVLGKPFLPNYPIPAGMTIEEFIRHESLRGLEERLAKLYDPARDDMPEIRQRYLERLDFELGIINQMGFPGYFLIVMEFIQWAKDNGIPVGPGRGSGAGSLVAYSLKITDLDPMAYDLLFERFLNPERVSMPDFDVDFCMDGRDNVIEHVAELYGHDAVSQIITFGTMAAKAVIRDVGRVQGKSYALADKLSKLVPFEVGMTLEKAKQDEPALLEFLAVDEEAQEIMEMAEQLEGLVRNVGKHAGGVVIAPTKLTDFTPLYCDESGGNLVTQFDKNDVESAGLVKFDFLGLRTLTIIDWAVKMLHEGGVEIDITRIPLDDAKVYELLERGETTAVFQLESRGMKDLIKRLKPSNFEDIIALVALFRPGPLGSGMVDDFIDRKHGRKSVTYPHADLEPVLKNTYGVILYQEQVMQIAQVLASYTLGGADMLRRAMGKKKPEEMQKQRAVFLEGAAARSIAADNASSIFDLMEKFADYGFNKSHSAAYALVSYQTAWLKYYYPSHFMAAVLTADMQNTDKIVTLVEECRRMGLSVLPPDVNVGRYAFTVDDAGRIIYGLGAIKGLGEGPVSALLRAREEGGRFADLFDFCKRVEPGQMNKRAIEALIRAGACDGFGADRAVQLAAIPDAVKMAEQNNRAAASGVEDLFGEITPHKQESADAYAAYRRVHRWSEQRRLQEEKETLGLYLSGHPIAEFLPELGQITRSRLDALKPDKAPQLVAGLIHDFRLIQTKRGDRICILTLDDQSDRVEATLYGDVYQQFQDQIRKDNVVLVEGVVSVDEYNGDGRLQLRARRVLGLEQARRQYARGLRLALHSPQLSVESLAFLRGLLAEYRCAAQVAEAERPPWETSTPDPVQYAAQSEGGCPVLVDLETGGVRGTLNLGAEWQVAPSEELLLKLRERLGQTAVSLSYQ
jgi:DNA polymerase-3 subunit alpha